MTSQTPFPVAAHRSGLVVDSLTVGPKGRSLVRDASFSAPRGAVTALIGPNGAGKTTAIRALTGATKPSGGALHLDGSPLLAMKRRERAQRIALVEQDATSMLSLDVASVVSMGRIPFQSSFAPRSSADAEIVRAALVEAGVDAFADRNFDSLSGGERQRVHIARALAQQPSLLVLDEPTNHLDLKAQLDTLALLRRRADSGVAVLAALHDLNLVSAFCDRVVVMVAGHVVAEGDVDDVLQPALVHAIYGVEVTIVPHPQTGRPVLTFGASTSEDSAIATGTGR
jgi:iron complex transport system ATP-binding protein